MIKHHFLLAAVLFPGIAMTDLSRAGQVSRDEGQRQALVIEKLQRALGGETTDAGKFTHIAPLMQDERDVNLRRRILDTAIRIPGSELEKFLSSLLLREEDAGLRSQAATALGLVGSENCLPLLARVARNDRTTSVLLGDVGGRSSARRAATFAIAGLALRFPNLANDAAAQLRALPVVDAAKDPEGLADARIQALYQITRDRALLKPFYERLNSKDAGDRASGVIAFRFLKLKEAPAELLTTLKDASVDVRSWSALVLGEIGDPKTGTLLMRVAGNIKEETGVRCNAIDALGRMRLVAAGNLMETLLTDPNASVPGSAAVALYRITGKKVKQFPEGYRAD
jgi:HEAT repeat protein